MPRRARIDVPGAIHHLIIRGIERKRIFRDHLDRDNFLERLGNLFMESKTPCYAWALLSSHVHLLVRTGEVPLASIMRRLLTGYAVTYNHRYQRHGQLFQNRYKSILCQEDSYLLELVRYIHLNPLRAKIVSDLSVLERYEYSGHSAILGFHKRPWQDIDYILGYFGRKVGPARKKYRNFVQEGIGRGRRPELVGGGLIRSLGGWKAARGLRGGSLRLKGDERILGDRDFVLQVLKASEEELERKYRSKAEGYTLEKLAAQVAGVLGLEPKDLWSVGKYGKNVRARSLFCYWAVREFGWSATEVARRIGITQPAVSISVKRGEQIAKEMDLKITEL